MQWYLVKRDYQKILTELHNPPFKLVTPNQWNTSYPLYRLCTNLWGRCAVEDNVLTTRFTTRDRISINITLWHEVGHLIWPYNRKPHWWVEAFANVMMYRSIIPYGESYLCSKYGHSPRELPPRQNCLNMAIKILLNRQLI